LNVDGSVTPLGKVEYALIVCTPNVAVNAGKFTFAVLFGVTVPVQLNVVGVPPSIVYEIVAEVKFDDPLFFIVTLGVIDPTQLSPTGLMMLTIDASLTFGGVHAFEVINDARIGLLSRTIRIRAIWSYVKMFIHASSE